MDKAAIFLGPLGGFIFKRSAKAIWKEIPDSIKISVINKILDGAIAGASLSREASKGIPMTGGYISRLMSSVIIGFYRTIRNLPDDKKLWMFHRYLRIILGGDMTFSWNFFKRHCSWLFYGWFGWNHPNGY